MAGCSLLNTEAASITLSDPAFFAVHGVNDVQPEILPFHQLCCLVCQLQSEMLTDATSEAGHVRKSMNERTETTCTRRELLIGASVASISGVAGCSGLTDPDMEFQNSLVPDPRVVSVDTDGNEYFAIIQNRGGKGNIRVELWYFQDSEVPNPSVASMYQNGDHAGRHFDLARTRYFDAEERRGVSIMGSNNSPIQSGTREFGMISWPASHGAVFKNTGDSGEVEFRFEYRDTRGYDTEEPPNQLKSVGSDESIEVVFDTVIPSGAEYEIVAEPV